MADPDSTDPVVALLAQSDEAIAQLVNAFQTKHGRPPTQKELGVPPMLRRIIQISTCANERGAYLYALADDGTVWTWTRNDPFDRKSHWSPFPLLPSDVLTTP